MAFFIRKVQATNSQNERLSLLTLAPSSWTQEQSSIFFAVSKYSVAKAHELKINSGILAQPPKIRHGYSLSDGRKPVTR